MAETAPAEHRAVGRRLTRFAIALAMLPLLVSAVALVVTDASTGYPSGDRALIELRTRDVGHHPVLVGLGSRDGWSHPGPALFYLLAAPYRLSGSASIGINLGALVISGLAILGMGLLAQRRGGTPLLLLTLVGCGLLVRSLGPDFLRDPWNPYVPVLPFGLLLFLCWGMACGDTWALPVAAGLMSFCVQTHVGYAVIAIPLLAWSAGWLALSACRGDAQRRSDLARAVLIAVGVLLVLWVPPVVDQIHFSNNMGKIADYFANSDDKVHTLGDGYRAVVAQFGVSAEWMTGIPRRNPFNGEPYYLESARFPALLIPFAPAAVVLWRRRAPGPRRLIVTLSLTLVLGVFAVSRILGPIYEYRLRWTWVIAMMVALVAAWAAASLVSRRWLEAISIAALVALAGVNSVSAARAGPLNERESSALRHVTPSVVARLPPGAGDVIVRPTSFGSSVYASGLVLQLERRGVAARVDHGYETGFGEWRIHRRGPVRSVLTVAADNTVEKVSARADLERIAYWDTLSLATRTDSIERLAQLNVQHEAGRLTTAEYLELAARVPLGHTLAVFMPKAAPRR